jgi:hypothetical protein
MDFESLLGRKLKDEQVVELLEKHDIEVVYEFDRTHENLADVYWATAKASGFQLRFDGYQKLDVVFLYTEAGEGFSAIAHDDVDIPLYGSFDQAKQDFTRKGISFVESQSDKWWIKGDFGDNSRHYEFRNNALFLVALNARNP